MTDQSFPITPPLELVQQLYGLPSRMRAIELAYQAGADQELEACCEWLRGEYDWGLAAALCLDAARRPYRPPSETEQALETLNWIEAEASYDKTMFGTIRRALERLKKLEEIK